MASKFTGKNNTAGVSAYVDSRGEQAVLGKLSRLMSQCEPTMVKVVDAGADTVYRSAVQRVPKRTGTLCRSIHKEVYKGGAVAGLAVGASFKGTTVLVGTDCSYAVYVEKGTCKMRARPYLQPAFAENASKVRRNMNEAFAKLINGEAKR